MQFDRQGRRITSFGQMSMVVQKKRHRGRPSKLETAILDKIATIKPANVSSLIPKKRGRGRPRKYPVESENDAATKPSNVSLLLPKKRGRGRPRKYTVESENEATIKPNYIAGVKEKLKLLEAIVSAYKEIEKIDKETQKNVEKFCALVHNSK